MGKEDRTLKAIHRVVDVLSSGSATNGKRPAPHVPYRDSKLTRLLSRGFASDNSIALICLSDSNGMYDETSVMLEFMTKVRAIHSSFTTDSLLSPVRVNRQKETEKVNQEKITLSEKLGIDLHTYKASTDIELDMNSPLDLVDLRNALAQLEYLQIDPLA